MKPKVLLIGLPIFIVQLVLVYFITANILISQDHSSTKSETKKEEVQNTTESNSEGNKESKEGESKSDNDTSKKTAGQFLFTLEDVICNPAESNGRILVLTSLGFDMNSAESKKTMEERTVILRDIVISNIAKKTVAELNNVNKRDSLKIEIIKNIESKIPVKINDLYFSKFIIQ